MRSKNILLAACTLLFCVIVFAYSLSAAPITDESFVIADFEDSGDGFIAGTNADGVHCETTQLEENGGAVERTALYVECAYRYASVIRSAKCEFSDPIDLSEYRFFDFDIYPPIYEHDENALYYARLNLVSEDGTVNYSLSTVEGGKWNRVSSDISLFGGRDAIVEAEIQLLVDTSVKMVTSHGFYIDSVGASGLVDRQMINRFLFDTYTVTGATAEVARGKSAIVMTAEESEPVSLKASVFMPDIDYPVNCLRIKLANKTDSTSMVLHYKTLDSQAESEDKSIVIPISPQSDATYYYAPVGDASMLQSFEMLFGNGLGEIKLYSIGSVWRYEEEDYAVCGKITSCKLGYAGESVCISGEIDRDAALSYQDSSIAVYAWNGDEMPTDAELALLTPIVSGEMTTRFELIGNLNKNDRSQRYSRFLAVVVHTDGSYTLIAPLQSVSNPEIGAASAGGFEYDLKGMAADDLSLVCDTDVGITVLTLDARSAFSGKSESTPYVYGGSLYYFSTEYFDRLSKKINMLSESGVEVLLRIEGLNAEYEKKLTAMYEDDDYISNQRTSELADGTDYIGALSEYTSERWASDGSVCGVILGLGENCIAGSAVSMEEQAKISASQLRSVYCSYISKNKDARVYLSVTDLFDSDPIMGNGEYVLSEYIPLFAAVADTLGGFKWGLCVEVSSGDREMAEYVEVTDCQNLLDLLSKYGVEQHILFCDSSYLRSGLRLSALMRSYVLGYYSAFFNPNIDAYIAQVGTSGSLIADTVKYIDTFSADTITSAALISGGAGGLDEIIDGYDEEMLPRRKLTSGTVSREVPFAVDGSYSYFDFGSALGISDMWYGCFAKDMQVVNSDVGAVMSVQLDSAAYGDKGRATWSGIAHRFDPPENLKPAPMLKIILKIDGVVPASVKEIPIKLVLTGENERFEAVSTVTAGEWTTLYFDIKDFGDIKNTETLQIMAGDSKIYCSTLSVRSIDGLSAEYDSDELKEVIVKEREKKLSKDERGGYTAYYWIGGAVLIAIATILAFVLLNRRRGGTDE